MSNLSDSYPQPLLEHNTKYETIQIFQRLTYLSSGIGLQVQGHLAAEPQNLLLSGT